MVFFKKWIGNQRAKERKRANQNVVDGEQNMVPHKRAKGERKVAARSLFYRHLSKEGIFTYIQPPIFCITSLLAAVKFQV